MPISFKQRFMEPVLSGRKRVTIRKATTLQPGDIVGAYCHWGAPPFAQLLIERVEPISLVDASDELAAADGFESGAAFREFMRSLYGEDFDEAVLISFKIAS